MSEIHKQFVRAVDDAQLAGLRASGREGAARPMIGRTSRAFVAKAVFDFPHTLTAWQTSSKMAGLYQIQLWTIWTAARPSLNFP